ncbi:hypothetical protein AB0M32_16360 [Streptomyces sp. NPDC051985]|uniref:hypothetical protein n=1 Tax=Streptomyces sp. NPDC051985 TaxID=3155807 RepID=UPI00341F47DC
MRAPLWAGLVGGVMGAVMSGLLNYFVLDVPDSGAANAVNNAVSGLMSGFTAGFFGILAYLRSRASSAEPADAVEEGQDG